MEAARPSTGVAVTAALLMGYYVAARATRDTLFLTSVGIGWLPLMVALAALASIALALYLGAWIANRGPRGLVPLAFLASAGLTLLEWRLVTTSPVAGSVIFYLHVAGLGPVLVSGFWAVVNDSLDPVTTRGVIGRIAALATLGGLIGSLVAERVAAGLGVPAMLPILAASNLWCAWSTRRIGSGAPPAPNLKRAGPDFAEGWRTLTGDPHLRNLALIVLGASVSAALLDYAFKTHATRTSRESLDLMRVLLGFNGLVALGTFGMQLLFTRLARGRTWIVRTISTLPALVLASGVLGGFFPFPWLVAGIRGGEAVIHGSLFRGGYELLYAGLRPALRNSVRSLIDVGIDRSGDVLGYGLGVFVLMSLPVLSTSTLCLLASAIAGVTWLIVLRLPRGHGLALEESLRNHAADLRRSRLSSLNFSMGGAALNEPQREPSEDPGPAPAPVTVDPDDPTPTIVSPEELPPEMIPRTIRRLGTPDSREDATRALTQVAARHVGQLVDALLDQQEDLAVRCAIPAILASCPGVRAAEGLAHGLLDHRFDIRTACALALVRLQERGEDTRLPREGVYRAVLWEARIERQVWDQLQPGRPPLPPAVRRFLRERAERSLDHMFTVLSLAFPRPPLTIALQGAKSDDRVLRATAREYLDELLPPELRQAIEPALAVAADGFGDSALPPAADD